MKDPDLNFLVPWILTKATQAYREDRPIDGERFTQIAILLRNLREYSYQQIEENKPKQELAWALCTVLDGQVPHDLPSSLGLNEEMCSRIWDIYQKALKEYKPFAEQTND